MEMDQIETFLAVATFGGFHRAAEALRVSQPAVSARIKALEQSIGVSLFARSRAGLTLSTAGRTFKPFAEQLLRTASLARQAVHELKPGSGGPLQIAAALSISVYFLPDVLKRFQRRSSECDHQHSSRKFQRSFDHGAKRRSGNRPGSFFATSGS